MVTQAALARRVRRLETLVGDAGNGMVYIKRGSGMRGLAEARRFLEEKRNPRPASALSGMASLKADIERCKAMIEARLANEPSEPEPPIVPLPRPTILSTTPKPPVMPPRPPRPPMPAPSPTPKAAQKPAAKSADYNWSSSSVWERL